MTWKEILKHSEEDILIWGVKRYFDVIGEMDESEKETIKNECIKRLWKVKLGIN